MCGQSKIEKKKEKSIFERNREGYFSNSHVLVVIGYFGWWGPNSICFLGVKTELYALVNTQKWGYVKTACPFGCK